jgi:hypothetical protein
VHEIERSKKARCTVVPGVGERKVAHEAELETCYCGIEGLAASHWWTLTSP